MKKLLSMALVAAMSMTALAGCASNSGDASGKDGEGK